MKLEKALDIISRIDAITEETSEDEIFNIIDDTYYLLALECKTKLDAMKEHIDDIIVSYDDNENAVQQSAPTVSKKTLAKQTAPSETVYEDEDAETSIDMPVQTPPRKKTEQTVATKRSTSNASTVKKSSAKRTANLEDDYGSLFD